jgi:hypothetical protein
MRRAKTAKGRKRPARCFWCLTFRCQGTCSGATEAADELRAAGYLVTAPADLDRWEQPPGDRGFVDDLRLTP